MGVLLLHPFVGYSKPGKIVRYKNHTPFCRGNEKFTGKPFLKASYLFIHQFGRSVHYLKRYRRRDVRILKELRYDHLQIALFLTIHTFLE